MSTSEVKTEETAMTSDKEITSVGSKTVVSKDSGGWDTIGRLSTLKKNLRTLSAHTSRKPVDEVKNKNEPSRFLGEGVSYKAKLIGILEVSDPRGDRMCQEALADLKMAIRAAGEHKQRITINIAIDGLRLRDEKTQDCLYHHPVHKISFIAQDMSDSRAFGYIFGSPDTGHRFFGIKTDKAASQVVISMRDLFQVVFELKKKEIEMAKQHIEQHQIKYGMGIYGETASSKQSSDLASTSSKLKAISEDSSKDSASKSAANSEAIADLLDLEFELNNIQQGLNQMERITPSDPFGDSFAPPASVKLAPPPTKPTPSPKERSWLERDTPPPSTSHSAPVPDKEQHWFDRETEALFDDEAPTSPPPPPAPAPATSQPKPNIAPVTAQPTKAVPMEDSFPEPNKHLTKEQFDVFTDLDPLGTGKIKPYIDKKDFFQELKNPPKKVLKDLVGEPINESNAPLFQVNFDSNSEPKPEKSSKAVSRPVAPEDPFGDDPFDKTDPFSDVEFSQSVNFSVSASATPDPFETSFADFTNFSEPSDFSATSSFDTPIRKSPQPFESTTSVHGPLRVSLPPEKVNDNLDPGSPKFSSSPPSSRNKNRYSRLHKQYTLSGLVKLPSPKHKARSRISKQNTLDSNYERNSPIMEGVLLKSRGLATPSPPNVSFLNDLAPEPPPRPVSTTSGLIKPPPLPPKKQLQNAILKPPPRPPQSDDPHYDYIENCGTSGDLSDVKSPPIPVPARRPRYGGDESSAPNRPSKANLPPQTEPEYYLTPFPLLPPPQKKNISPKNSTSSEPSVSPRPFTNNAVSSLDITLSQLSTTGFSDLAATLNMSPTSLSKMTLQELTKCLQNLTEAQKHNPSTEEFIEDGGKLRKNVLKSEQYSALRESLDEDTPPFKAEFDTHFDLNIEKKVVNKEEESLFDKYAVFRELLEQEKTIVDKTSITTAGEKSYCNPKRTETVVEKPKPVQKPVEKSNSEIIREVKFSEPMSTTTIDRYAALRDICLDDEDLCKETDRDGSEPLSDKDDSTGDITRCEDELDTLTLSRPHSESTDSPTATIKETQSIMESTIMEEDASALDDEEVLDEAAGELLGTTLPTVAESNESLAGSDSPLQSAPMKDPSISSLQSLKGEVFSNDKDRDVDPNSLGEGWAKFENCPVEVDKSGSMHSEGNVSPWSIDSKDASKEPCSPAWRDQPNRRARKGRRHKPPEWQEDDESEEGWGPHRSRNTSWDEPPWRENGWSDGDSLYDETPPYDFKQHPQYHNQRRGRRRKISPWRKTSRDPSPWDEDDRDLSEDQWENKRWEESSWQARPKHRGPSWEEERKREDLRRDDLRRDETRRSDSRRDEQRREESRRDDPRRDDSRKRRPSPWGTEGDRRSSRESLTWEEDERYSRRNYRDRRRRRWEDPNYSRRDWREREQGRRNYNQYYRDRSHESPWEDEFSEQGDEDSPRCQTRKQVWNRSRNSEDEQYEQRYNRPSSREEQNLAEADAHWARKSQTLATRSRSNRNKKQSQNSPFEDDFSSQNFVFPSEKSPGAGSDLSDYGTKTVQSKPQSSPDEVLKRKDGFGESVDFSPQDSKGLTPRSQQSPFEDDFTPPETRRNGRKHSSESSEKRVHLEDRKSNDDVFLGDSFSSDVGRPRVSKLDKNITEHSISKKLGKAIHSDQSLGKFKTESETLSEELASKKSSDKRQGSETKPRNSNLRSRSDLNSVKSDSVNIFTRSGDPFDDDFFSADSSSSTLTRSKDKSKKSDPFKWTEAFSAFNFDEESK